jgi:hypothetical protein
MAIREKLRAKVVPLLEPGEEVQAVIPAQTTSAYFALISYWIIVFKNSYRVLVATDRRILVCKAGRMFMTTVKGIDYSLPRATRIGPGTGLWHRFDTPQGKLYVNRRFFKDIETADNLIP